MSSSNNTGQQLCAGNRDSHETESTPAVQSSDSSLQLEDDMEYELALEVTDSNDDDYVTEGTLC